MNTDSLEDRLRRDLRAVADQVTPHPSELSAAPRSRFRTGARLGAVAAALAVTAAAVMLVAQNASDSPSGLARAPIRCGGASSAEAGNVIGGDFGSHRWELHLRGAPPELAYEAVVERVVGSGSVTHSAQSWERLIVKGELALLATTFEDAGLHIVAGEAPRAAAAVRLELSTGRDVEVCPVEAGTELPVTLYATALAAGAKVQQITIVDQAGRVLAAGLPPRVDPSAVKLPLRR